MSSPREAAQLHPAAQVHPTALVSPQAHLGVGVTVGPFAIVEPGAVVGEGCALAARAFVGAGARLAAGVQVGIGAVVGSIPQDRKYDGAPTLLEVGAGAVIREYATLNISTTLAQATRVGAGCLVMAYAHVAHDCFVGERCVLSNGVQLGGHVIVGAGSNLGGLSAVHQFCTVGAGSFVGGLVKVDRDVPPYSKVLGHPAAWGGFNLVGAERAGLEREQCLARERALRVLYRHGLLADEALGRIDAEFGLPEWREFAAVRRMQLLRRR